MYNKISEELEKVSYRRMWDTCTCKCRGTVKKVKQDDKKVVDNKNTVGRERKSFKFLEAMDAVLGH